MNGWMNAACLACCLVVTAAPGAGHAAPATADVTELMSLLRTVAQVSSPCRLLIEVDSVASAVSHDGRILDESSSRRRVEMLLARNGEIRVTPVVINGSRGDHGSFVVNGAGAFMYAKDRAQVTFDAERVNGWSLVARSAHSGSFLDGILPISTNEQKSLVDVVGMSSTVNITTTTSTNASRRHRTLDIQFSSSMGSGSATVEANGESAWVKAFSWSKNDGTYSVRADIEEHRDTEFGVVGWRGRLTQRSRALEVKVDDIVFQTDETLKVERLSVDRVEEFPAGTFEPTIQDGVPVVLEEEAASGVPYEWRSGRVVPAVSEVEVARLRSELSERGLRVEAPTDPFGLAIGGSEFWSRFALASGAGLVLAGGYFGVRWYRGRRRVA